MTRFDTIIFDLDNTLIDEQPNINAAYRAAARYAHDTYGVAAQTFVSAATLAARDTWWEPDWLGPITDRYGLSAWDGLSEQFPGPGPDLQQLREWLPTYRHAAWQAAYARCGITADRHVLDQTARTFTGERHRGRVRLTPGAARALASLADRDLAIITNGPTDGQESKVYRAGLGRIAKAVITSTTAGVGKPDPRLLDHCLQRLPPRNRRMLVIGDSFEHDIRLALLCGVPAIWIRPSDSTAPVPSGVTVVSSPAALPTVISRLEDRR